MALPAKKFVGTDRKPPPRVRWQWGPPSPPTPTTDKCVTCESRWEDVQFYGLPGSALCGSCPRRSDWTGRIFDADRTSNE